MASNTWTVGYGVFVWGLFLVGGIMCISRPFSPLSTLMAISFSSRLCLWDPSSMFYLPLTKNSKLFADIINSVPQVGCMGFVVRGLHLIHLDFFIKAKGLSLSCGCKAPRQWLCFLFLTDSSWLMRGAMHHQRYLILWIYIIYASQTEGQMHSPRSCCCKKTFLFAKY